MEDYLVWGTGTARFPLVRDAARVPAPWPETIVDFIHLAGLDPAEAWCVEVQAEEHDLDAQTRFDSCVLGYRRRGYLQGAAAATDEDFLVWGLGTASFPPVRDAAPLPHPWPGDVCRVLAAAQGGQGNGGWCVRIAVSKEDLEARTRHDAAVLGFRPAEDKAATGRPAGEEFLVWGTGMAHLLVRHGTPIPPPWPGDLLRRIRAAGHDIAEAWCVRVEGAQRELEDMTRFDSAVIGFRPVHSWRDKLRNPELLERADFVQFGGAIDINDYTGFAEGDEFGSEFEVRSYFRTERMHAEFGLANDLTQGELDLMADVVLELRLHCAF